VLLTGVFPRIFALTGVIMWLCQRADRKAVASKRGTAQWRPPE